MLFVTFVLKAPGICSWWDSFQSFNSLFQVTRASPIWITFYNYLKLRCLKWVELMDLDFFKIFCTPPHAHTRYLLQTFLHLKHNQFISRQKLSSLTNKSKLKENLGRVHRRDFAIFYEIFHKNEDMRLNLDLSSENKYLSTND